MYVTEILERCGALAERSAKLYRLLAERFSQDSERRELCHELALVEETHAKVLAEELASFREQDQLGEFLPELGQRLTEIERHVAEVEKRILAAQTLEETTACLLALQQTSLEELYDDLVVQGDPSFRIFIERLEATFANSPKGARRRRWQPQR